MIGGGLPVGAYGGSAKVMELVAPAGPVYQAGTLSGNPLAMTAGLWSLSELSPRLYKHLAKLGSQLANGLAEAARSAGVALQVNALGSLLTPFFTDRERAALEWTEAVTRVGDTHVPDEIYERAAAQFNESELVTLTLGVAVINSWNRLAISFRAPAGTYRPKAHAA